MESRSACIFVAAWVGILGRDARGATPGQHTEKVSVDAAGNPGNDRSIRPALSQDGRYVAFRSGAFNLVPGDTNYEDDVLVYDRMNRTFTLVSVDSTGAQGNDGKPFSEIDMTDRPAISGDGRYVAFASEFVNLVAGDTNGQIDVFVHDGQTGVTTRVSVDSTGAEANNSSLQPSISADGRYVAFMSHATNLVAGDTNGCSDVFVHDCQTGVTTRVSVDAAGIEGNGNSSEPAISADGRHIAFTSFATNLVPGDGNLTSDVFVIDRQTGSIVRASVDSTGAEGNRSSDSPAISADGRFIAFRSAATNLVAGDSNRSDDVFVRDEQTGATSRASVSSTGIEGNHNSARPAISADGRFVAFQSDATNLVPNDLNAFTDIFLFDRLNNTTTRSSVDATGSDANSWSGNAAISGDGRFVAFDSYANDLIAGDRNRWQDVFVRGPYLILEADPEEIDEGATLTLTAFGGQPSGATLFAIVDVDGTPTFILCYLDAFDGNGIWTVSETVPSGLSGLVITGQSFGVAPTGKVEASNREVITFD